MTTRHKIPADQLAAYALGAQRREKVQKLAKRLGNTQHTIRFQALVDKISEVLDIDLALEDVERYAYDVCAYGDFYFCGRDFSSALAGSVTTTPEQQAGHVPEAMRLHWYFCPQNTSYDIPVFAYAFEKVEVFLAPPIGNNPTWCSLGSLIRLGDLLGKGFKPVKPTYAQCSWQADPNFPEDKNRLLPTD